MNSVCISRIFFTSWVYTRTYAHVLARPCIWSLCFLSGVKLKKNTDNPPNPPNRAAALSAVRMIIPLLSRPELQRATIDPGGAIYVHMFEYHYFARRRVIAKKHRQTFN